MVVRFFLSAALAVVCTSLVAQPEIKFEDKTQKFEKVKAGEILSFDFFYVNTGDAPLIITHIKVACTCTQFEYPKEPLMPGEKAVIKVTFDTNKKYGYQDRTLEVYTNAKEAPIKIRFKGVVDNKPPKK